ncbi:restriction endonuclease subunit S [Nostoc sp.]|uniref:restriction endonuclease subunit S n=1 Tax=Nostoc sp. TaxID=1180 RepID=UPI002FF77D7E
MRDGQILWEQAAKIPENTYVEISKGREPVAGLILYTAVGSYGHAALVRKNCQFSFQRHIAYVLPNTESVSPEYLVTFLNSPQCRKYADQVALGNAQKTITLSALCGFPVLLSKYKEQQCIAEILDTVDDAIARTSSPIIKLKQTKAGLLQDLLTRGLDDDGKLRNPQAHPEQFKDSPLGRIPREWKIYLLEECVRSDSQITYGIVQAGPHVEGGIPYIRTGDMGDDQLSIEGLLRTSSNIVASYRRSEVRTGEIVCAIRATVGKVLEVPVELDGANLTQGTARIAPREDINNHYLLWILRSISTKHQFDLVIKGTTFLEITLENLRKIKVALPSCREEQDKIAVILDTNDTRIRTEQVYLNKLKLQKQGLMQDLLTGKVRVKNL